MRLRGSERPSRSARSRTSNIRSVVDPARLARAAAACCGQDHSAAARIVSMSVACRTAAGGIRGRRIGADARREVGSLAETAGRRPSHDRPRLRDARRTLRIGRARRVEQRLASRSRSRRRRSRSARTVSIGSRRRAPGPPATCQPARRKNSRQHQQAEACAVRRAPASAARFPDRRARPPLPGSRGDSSAQHLLQSADADGDLREVAAVVLPQLAETARRAGQDVEVERTRPSRRAAKLLDERGGSRSRPASSTSRTSSAVSCISRGRCGGGVGGTGAAPAPGSAGAAASRSRRRGSSRAVRATGLARQRIAHVGLVGARRPRAAQGAVGDVLVVVGPFAACQRSVPRRRPCCSPPGQFTRRRPAMSI